MKILSDTMIKRVAFATIAITSISAGLFVEQFARQYANHIDRVSAENLSFSSRLGPYSLAVLMLALLTVLVFAAELESDRMTKIFGRVAHVTFTIFLVFATSMMVQFLR